MGNTIVLFSEQENTKHGACIFPLAKKVSDKNFKEFKSENWDVSCESLLFLRQSHENNQRHKMGYKSGNGIECSRIAICAWPSSELKNNKE